MDKNTGKMSERGGDRPGKEISKDYREVVIELIDNQGWRYDAGAKRGKPMLFPADRTMAPVMMANTPSDSRGMRNFIAQVRRNGGVWPPPRRKR